MNKVKKAARKITVSLIGFPLLVVGIILIPLPGPGLIISFVAVMILSNEFEWANSRLEQIKREFKKIYKKAKERSEKIENWEPKRKKR